MKEKISRLFEEREGDRVLVRFIVRNFRSINDEIELSMIPGRARKHSDHIFKDARSGGYNLLKTSVLYGANAAGKSNIVEAIRFAQQLIIRGTRGSQRIRFPRFRLDKQARNRPARFEFEIKVSDKAYAYGFELTPESIQSEWLYEIGKTTESRQLFDRTTNNDKLNVEINSKALGIGKDDSKFLEFVARGTRPNQLFLTECSERNVSHFSNVMLWFREVLSVLPPPSVPASPMSLRHTQDATLADSIIDSLRRFSIDISGIHLEEIEDEEAQHQSAIWTDIFDELPGDERQVMIGGSQGRIVIRQDEDGNIKTYRLVTTHTANDGSDVKFEFDDESDGTMRLIDLLSGFLTSLENERVFVVDELDRSLHPILSYNFVDYFLKSTEGFPNQLIVTTHESGLLDLDMLRRDEIWFVEKNKLGATELYSLEEFTPRHDKDVRRGYLQGRYGAIPLVRKVSDLGWQ